MSKFKTEEQKKDLEGCINESLIPDKTKAKDIKPVEKVEPKGKCPMKITMDGDAIQDVTFKEPYNSMIKPFDNVLKDLTAISDNDIAREIFDRSALAMPKDKNAICKINIMLQSLADSGPKDATETRLSLQSTVLYSQGMKHLYNAENSNRIDYCEYYMKSAIKLLRLHNETIEALCKYRRGGEQRVVVQHVQVNNGGKAIVGNVLNGGG